LNNASKFAVEGLSEELAFELKPLGIHVTLVEPAYLRTHDAHFAGMTCPSD
jgi:NAD(P)-dependent dehydrogenase (short-subunit alcohol dehydrogenase family)